MLRKPASERWWLQRELPIRLLAHLSVYFEVLALVPLDPVTTPRTDCPSL